MTQQDQYEGWIRTYRQFGWVVVPLTDRRTPLYRWTHYRETPEQYELDLETWASDDTWERASGIGLLTEFSNVAVFDVDVDESEAYRHLSEVTGCEVTKDSMPYGLSRTQSGQLHIFFDVAEYAGPIPNISSDLAKQIGADHVELKRHGMCVPLPPTVTKKGRYEWIHPPRSDGDPLDALPDWANILVARARDYAAARRLEAEEHHAEQERTRKAHDETIQKAQAAGEDVRQETSIEESGRALKYQEKVPSAIEGERTATLIRLAGGLCNAHFSEDAVHTAIEAYASRCDPPYPSDELESSVFPAIRKWLNPQPHLIRVNARTRQHSASSTGDELSRSTRDSIYPAGAEPDTDTDTYPTITLSPDMTAVVDAAEAALLDADAGIYQRSGVLVRVVTAGEDATRGIRRDSAAPIVGEVPQAHLMELLSASARWQRENKKGGFTPTMPPMWAVNVLAARGSWQFPTLTGVLTTPTIRPNGDLLTKPGYDPDTGFLLAHDLRLPDIPHSPTESDAKAAARRVIDDCFGDFPFVADTDKAATMAALLTLLALPAIDGPTPMFSVSAPVAGSGKTKLVDAISIIATGATAARMTLPRDDEEMRKRVFALAAGGDSVALIDNISRPFASDALCAAITGRMVKDRVLGKSEIRTLPLNTVFAATGNNLRPRGDLARRIVPISLDPRMPDPEERTGFKHAPLEAWIRDNRGSLVRDSLLILRAFCVAGRPHDAEARPYGSFEAWDELVRHAVIWATGHDPLAGRDALRADDPEREALEALLSAWADAFDTGEKNAVTTQQAIDRAQESDDAASALRGALLEITGADNLDTRRIGLVMRKFTDRVVWVGTDALAMRRGPRRKQGIAHFVSIEACDTSEV